MPADPKPAELSLRVWPDPILKKRAKPYALPLPPEVAEVGARMLEIMYSRSGVGLAGPQAGLLRRILVYDVSEGRDEPVVLVNPEIVSATGALEYDEGCLSFPEIRATVDRHAEVTVRGLLPSGEPVEITADSELMAVMFQHELDHLDGIVFIDRLSPSARLALRADLKELELLGG